MGLLILDYLLVTYHFAAQHFGVLSLYRVRAGRTGAPRARLLDRLFALGVGGPPGGGRSWSPAPSSSRTSGWTPGSTRGASPRRPPACGPAPPRSSSPAALA